MEAVGRNGEAGAGTMHSGLVNRSLPRHLLINDGMPIEEYTCMQFFLSYYSKVCKYFYCPIVLQ